MATESKKTPAPVVDYSGMNICRKLQIARLKFLQAGVKKTCGRVHFHGSLSSNDSHLRHGVRYCQSFQL